MLFNSYEFILLFLPVVLLVFRLLARLPSQRPSLCWLIVASLLFYGWHTPAYLGLLLCSIVFNYAVSHLIVRRDHSDWRRAWLAAGVCGNLVPLAYYKYGNFTLQNLQALGLLEHTVTREIVLPLAISFFTFQQIAFLADAYRTGKAHHSLLEYMFCVVFFPHLIAGPLIYYREFLAQISQGRLQQIDRNKLAHGSVLFVLGLAKKVLIGDSLGALVGPVYDGAAGPSGAFDAWMGSILYGFQIYFDFSAYSDMAVGLAYLCGLKLPINFDSPYRSVTYREFWRRWHVTLFRFFRDHVYLPLQGGSPSRLLRFALTFLVFFLSGLWHGAAWTFVAWGIANWALIVLNDLWLLLPGLTALRQRLPPIIRTLAGRLFVFICMSWTFMLFRAPDFGRAHAFVKQAFAATSLEGSVVLATLETAPAFVALHQYTAMPAAPFLAAISIALLALVWCLPNAVRLMLQHEPEYHDSTQAIRFAYRWPWCLLVALLGWAALLGLPSATQFIYFQF